MAMSNLMQMFEYNYDHNWEFSKYCDSLGIMYTGFYGESTARKEDMKKAKSAWIKAGHVYYQSMWECQMACEAMPFGGWETEKKELEFLKKFRKVEKLGSLKVRAFMREYMEDPEWDF